MSSLLLWLYAALAVVSPGFAFDPEDGGTDAIAQEVLKSPDYAFCHDEDYPLLPEERGWCELVGDPSANCPAFPKVCKGKPGHLEGPRGRYSTRKASDEAAPPPTNRGDGRGWRRKQEREKTEVELPALGGLGQLLFWIVIAVAVLGAPLRDRLQPWFGPDPHRRPGGDAAGDRRSRGGRTR